MTPIEVGAEFDGYRLIRSIGAGGMGSVYLGHDTVLDRPVAVKFISMANPDRVARNRFLVEARAIARLLHPCVVAVYRAGEVSGQPYIVSEYVDGQSLDKLELPAPSEVVLPIAFDLARGLAVAHQAGVIHRDIKPANAILAADGTAKLLDFGIARLMEPSLAPTPSPPLLAEWPSSTSSAPCFESQAGQIVGTPAFMAPEVWCGDGATFASDVYSLGAMLFTLCAGQPPHMADSIELLADRAISNPAPRLLSVAPATEPRLAAIIDRCLNMKPADRFPSAGELRAALDPLVSPATMLPIPEGNPYRGLRHFMTEHQAFFFGRDSEIREIVDRIQTDPVVIVTGDSGVGKSSLCRAGVLSRAPGWLHGPEQWSVLTVVPGEHPLVTLCEALREAIGLPEEVLREALAGGPSSFGRCLRSALGREHGLLIFIDQLEELITLSVPEEAQVLGALIGWSRDPVPGVRILSTIRADFLGRLAALPGVGGNLSNLLYFLRPLSEHRLREAINGPAEATGLRFETPEMISTLAASAAGAGGGLPLLQFTLQKLWELRDPDRQVIPAAALDTLGGVGGALSIHADELLSGLGPARRNAARRIFLRLVTQEGTRARRSLAELTDGEAPLEETLNALVRGRLIVAIDDRDGPVFEVAHEALLSNWSTLVHWLHEDVDARVVHDRLVDACQEWRRLERSREPLWSGRLLEEARMLDASLLAPVEAAFLAASRRNELRRRFTRWIAALVVLSALLGTYGIVHHRATRERDARVAEHVTAGTATLVEAAGLASALDAAEQEAYGWFDSRRAAEGEAAWARALKLRQRYREALSDAGRELETAVALDPSREDIRVQFAALLYQRALEAEARGAGASLDELLGRMRLYDLDQSRWAAYSAPASLSLVAVDGEDATATLRRYLPGDDGDLAARPVEAPSVLPWDALELPPGSYRVDLETPSGAEVRVPFLLRRGEDLSLEVPIAPAALAPEGFVYIPPGRFIFGGGQDEDLRKGFHHTVPAHEVTVSGYFIAVHETTFGDWIRYLESLAPEDRASRLPSVDVGGFEGALALEDLGDSRWRLTFKPTSTRYSATSDEPIEYPSRPRHRRMDWLRLPVVGLTAADASEYAAWLRRTGRVPGTRLCTDREWEFAARGADGREYPHGPTLAPTDANFDETYDKDPAAMGPDTVGLHPASESPFGLHDTAGNVWEWVTSSIEAEGHAARGGSFYFGANTGRTYNRETPEPSFRDTSVGFRLCADLPSSP